jgi:hypothetical protein
MQKEIVSVSSNGFDFHFFPLEMYRQDFCLIVDGLKQGTWGKL